MAIGAGTATSPSSGDYNQTNFGIDMRQSDKYYHYPNENRRYCFGKLKKKQFIGVIVTSVVAALLIVILVAIFVGGKAVAQSGIDSSTVAVKSMQLGAPVEGGNGVNVQIVGAVGNGSPFAAQLSAFTMAMEHEGKTFAEFPFPEMTLPGSSTTEYDIGGILDITDTEAFNGFAAKMLSEKNVTFSVKGSVAARALGLSFSGLSMDKVVTVMGLRGFNEPPVEVVSQNVVKGDKDSIEIAMVVGMVNPSSFAFNDTGKLTMRIYYEDTFMGFAVTDGDSVSIPRGHFLVNMTASILRNPENNDKLIDLLSKFTRGDDISMTMKGENTTIAMLSPSTKHLETITTFNGLKTLSTAQKAELPNLSNSPFLNMVSPINLASFTMARPIKSLPYMVQTVFSHMPGTIAQGLKTMDASGHPTVTVYQLTYNSLNVPIKVHGMNITSDFRRDTSGVFPLTDKMPPKDFTLAILLNSSDTTPLMELQAMETRLLRQTLLVPLEAATDLMIFYTWLYEAFNLDPTNGLPVGTSIADCKSRGISAAACSGPFSMPMTIHGTVDVTIGKSFRTKLNVYQEIVSQAALYDLDSIDIATMTYSGA